MGSGDRGRFNKNNGGQLDILGGNERTSEHIQGWRRSLSEWWGVGNREELLETLNWIEEGGQRKDFDELAEVISTASPKQLDRIRVQIGGGPEADSQVAIVLKYHPKFGKKSISAWDYSRYVSLCGWGYVAGYITEDEAWRRIMPAAKLMQTTFTSWDELGENYIVGREFWSLEQTNANGARMRSSFQSLLTDPRSPWVRLPWDLDLTATN